MFLVCRHRCDRKGNLRQALLKLFAQNKPKICVPEFSRIRFLLTCWYEGPYENVVTVLLVLPARMHFVQTDYLGGLLNN